MAYHIDIKNEVINLRKRGYSLNELHERTGVAKGTLSLWLRNIKLSETAKGKLINKINTGRYKSAENKRAKTRATEKKYIEQAKSEIITNPDYKKILCAIIHWCEGTKNPIRSGLTFTNSDPLLVAKYLELLRASFDIDESKFRPCIHLHEYHSPEKQLAFWSKITKIDREQFIKPYRKPNTGKRTRDGYQGCISIKYHSNDLARQVMAIAKAYLGV